MNKPTALQNGAHYTLTAAGDKNGTEKDNAYGAAEMTTRAPPDEKPAKARSDFVAREVEA